MEKSNQHSLLDRFKSGVACNVVPMYVKIAGSLCHKKNSYKGPYEKVLV